MKLLIQISETTVIPSDILVVGAGLLVLVFIIGFVIGRVK